jgi:hypothetical protein
VPFTAQAVKMWLFFLFDVQISHLQGYSVTSVILVIHVSHMHKILETFDTDAYNLF